MLNLQIFAEGGAGGAAGGTGGDGGTAQGQGVTGAAALPQTKGAKNNPLAEVKYGIQEDAAPAAEVQKSTEAPDLNAEFEKLIKGQYKEQYDSRVQDTIQKRLKSSKETVDKYNALTPTLELLAKKYGVDATDIEALNKAIEEDDSFFEEEALAKGLTVQQLKEYRKMERENANLKAQMQEQQTKENANKLYAGWMNQAEEAKKVYPSFDLKTEMNNPKFLELLRSNIDVRTAYEVIHKDEIISGAMQFTAKTVEQKIANKIAANGSRPSENGMRSQSASVVKSDVSQLSKADRAEIIRRVQRGEKIRF
jgi:hypothetical protein